MQTSEILNGAADHIERYGHHKGSGFRDSNTTTSPACAMGGMVVAAGGESIARNRANSVMRSYLGGFIGEWNDAPERTATEVIEALRAAALIEAAKENAETREPVSA